MSSAQERAAEVIQQHSIECTGLGGVTCGGCRDADWMSWFAYRRHLAAALAEANLLVDDDTARLVALGKAVEGLDPARWRWTRLVIYREAGVESPTRPETPPDGTPSEGDTAPVSGGAG